MGLIKKTINSPVGDLTIGEFDGRICLLEFANRASVSREILQIEHFVKEKFVDGNSEILVQLEKELDLYFNGNLKSFTVPLFTIGTDFQKKVWDILLQIPYGKTISYLEESTMIGKPSAMRAVANANGKNKVAIVIPCHRVIGKNGKLTGYGGGLDRKEFLLNIENPKN